MALAMQGPSRERPLEEVFACVLPSLPYADRATLRSVCTPLRNLTNGACSQLTLTTPAFHNLATLQLLKRFPRVNSVELMLSNPQEAKATTMFLLTSQPDQAAQLARLTLGENRIAAQQYHQQQSQGGGYGGGYGQPESRFQQYGYSSGAKTSPQTFDFTEPILASVCSCLRLKAISIDKNALLETEAAALARLTGLQELRLATNSSAQPLRRPLLQLMLNSMTRLRVLKLSYIRDTTADMVLSLPRLTHLTKLSFQYANWGESGAGERVMAALAKHQKQLADLQLYECCVNDDMLRLIMGITSLRRLHIQDEDAAEESCPTNKGLARITQLRRLEQLELFGEELQLDGELLGRLAQLPALRHLAMAGLDSLQADDVDSPAAFEAMKDLDADVEGMELSSSMGDEETEEDSFSVSVGGGDEATSRPQPSHPSPHGGRSNAAAPRDGSSMAAASCPDLGRGQQSRPSHQRPQASAGEGSAVAGGALKPQLEGCSHVGHQQQRFGQHTPGWKAPRALTLTTQPAPTAAAAGGAPVAPSPAPLQVLRRLQTLRLYGPSSLCMLPPPLALLLPQPQLRHLKLSACASHANLRALSQQSGLHKLIVSHTSVPQLYPPPGTAVPALEPSSAAAAGPGAAAATLPPPGASILGFHSEVVVGLASLHVLRIKDLPGLMDCHLCDLALALSRLPNLTELKLRALGMVSDGGVAALASVTKLRRLKLYELGDGVTEAGVAHLAACLPLLEELKVKDCRRVGPSLRGTLMAFRSAAATAAAQQQQPSLQQQQQPAIPIVRHGQKECEGGRKPPA
ncbi:hypothetical protein Agub_g15065 [Astrephomene gubernaculifera]|uniref:F-box domain-containing protein n=1 Tax=Astrephomene gubernaculifera TaxID=47775 RepID=A0AAD3E2G9_9CHLO|nr:hypothetical protein Agub_g15065 [Astrephomene gubernaculifera]